MSEAAKDTHPRSYVCEHGSLARSCEVCELQGEVKRLTWELDYLTNAGVIECAARNKAVSEYMDHWEGRTLKAEAEVARLTALLATALDGADEYWLTCPEGAEWQAAVRAALAQQEPTP